MIWIPFAQRIANSDLKVVKTKVLLVDDSKTIRTQYRKLLESQNYLVDLAVDAEDGFQKVQDNQYDLAIIDYFYVSNC